MWCANFAIVNDELSPFPTPETRRQFFVPPAVRKNVHRMARGIDAAGILLLRARSDWSRLNTRQCAPAERDHCAGDHMSSTRMATRVARGTRGAKLRKLILLLRPITGSGHARTTLPSAG